MAEVYIPRFETQTDQNVAVPWTNCTPASGSMLVDWWTWGALHPSDVELRAGSTIPPNIGMNFAALMLGIKAATGLTLRFSEPDGSGTSNISWSQLREHLATGGAAAVAGDYGKLAAHKTTTGLPVQRWQPGGTFGHAAFVVDYRPADGSLLWMDPLGRGGYAGDRIPLVALWDFIYKSTWADASARVAAAWTMAGSRPPKPVPAPPAPDYAALYAAEKARADRLQGKVTGVLAALEEADAAIAKAFGILRS